MDVILGGAAGSAIFKLIDVTTPAATTLASHVTAFSGCRVESRGSRAAVANVASGVIQFYAISETLGALLLGTTDVAPSGIAAVTALAVDGERVLAGGGANGFVALVDFTDPGSPTIVAADTGLSGIGTLGFSGAVAVAASANNNSVVPMDIGAGSITALAPFADGLSGNGRLVSLEGAEAAIAAVSSGAVGRFSVTASPATLAFITSHVSGPNLASIANAPGSWIAVGPSIGLSAFAIDIATGTVRTISTGFNGAQVAVTATRLYAANMAAATMRIYGLTSGAIPSLLAASTTDITLSRISFSTFVPASELEVDAPVGGLAFGSHCVGTNTDLSVTLRSVGSRVLTVNSITTAAPFSIVSPPVTPLTLAIGASLVVTVRFAPAASGAAAGSLDIASDDPASPASVVLAGTGRQDVVLTSAPSLDFGAVPPSTWIARALTITNGSATDPLDLTDVSTGSTDFGVLDAVPSSIPPSSLPTPPFGGPIGPGASVTLYVVFNPSSVAAFAASLTLSCECGSVVVPLTGTAVLPNVGACLVLDRSGSMSGAALGGFVNKMQALQNATHLFVDLMPAGPTYRIGSVEFDSTASNLTSFVQVDAAAKIALGNAVDLLTPRFATSIGGGIQVGRAQLAGTPVGHRKVMIVFTDGMENTAPMIAAQQPLAVMEGIQIYAVGLGTASTLDAMKLAGLASATGGIYFETADPLQLQKDFIQVLGDTFGLYVADDPIRTVASGTTDVSKMESTGYDRRLNFVCAWEDASRPLGFELVAPDGTTITPGTVRRDVSLLRRPSYAIYRITVGRLDDGGISGVGPFAQGTWSLRVTAPPGAGQRYITSFLVDSDFKFNVKVPRLDIGDDLLVSVQVDSPVGPLPPPKVTVAIAAPTVSSAQLVIRSLKSGRRPAPKDASVVPGRWPELDPRVRERNLRVVRRRGSFEARLVKAAVDGVYRVTATASIRTKLGNVTRYRSFSVVPTPTLSLKLTDVKFQRLPDGAVKVIVTPRDGGGNPLGIGRARDLKVIPGAGVAARETVDRLDGSYEVLLAKTPARGGKLAFAMTGKRLEVRLPAATPDKRKGK